MAKKIYQFGVKTHSLSEFKGVPLVDCRVLSNPYKAGVADVVLKERVKNLPGFGELVKQGVIALRKSDTVAIFCLFGVHRSGAVAEEVAKITGARIQKF